MSASTTRKQAGFHVSGEGQVQQLLMASVSGAMHDRRGIIDVLKRSSGSNASTVSTTKVPIVGSPSKRVEPATTAYMNLLHGSKQSGTPKQGHEDILSERMSYTSSEVTQSEGAQRHSALQTSDAITEARKVSEPCVLPVFVPPSIIMAPERSEGVEPLFFRIRSSVCDNRQRVHVGFIKVDALPTLVPSSGS
eukprot:4432549-Pyramimonas_sp.AAC.3